GTGAVYVFVRSGSAWSQQAKLTASDGGNGDNFGYSLVLRVNSNTALIGINNTQSAAAAYVFVRSGSAWSQQAKLTASHAVSGDSFGFPVALSADANPSFLGGLATNFGTGAAYVFVRSGSAWSQQAKLIASDGASGDKFGDALALTADGSTAL